MRVKYTEDPKQWGGAFDPDYTVYRNSPYQRGAGLGSLFRSLWRLVLPIAKSVGKSVGKQALKTGVQVADDVLAGQNLEQAVKRRGAAGAKKMLKQATKAVGKNQRGGGLGAKKKRATTLINRGRSRTKKPAKKRKLTKIDVFGQ